MIPLFFGPSDRALYGVYHAPAGGVSRRGVVLCYPTAEAEYYNAHRSLRTLALGLAAAGVHVLRFDYLGTGDSAGEPDLLGEADWLEDVSVAITELQDMAAIRSVGLIGLREGAALAVGAACRVSAVGRLALWDPVPVRDGAGPDTAPVRDLQAVLAEESDPIRADVLLVTTGPEPAAYHGLAGTLAEMCDRADHVHHDESGAWDGSPSSGLPVRSLQTLVDWARAEP